MTTRRIAYGSPEHKSREKNARHISQRTEDGNSVVYGDGKVVMHVYRGGRRPRMVEVIGEARTQGVHLLVTPELAVSGYSLKDRVWWPDIRRRSWDTLLRVAEHTRGISVWLGLPVDINSRIYNAVAFVHDGRVHGLVLKKYLPTYNVFYEGRNWSSWGGGVTDRLLSSSSTGKTW